MTDWIFHGLVGFVMGVTIGACLAIIFEPATPTSPAPTPGTVTVEIQPPCTTTVGGVPVRC